MIPLPGSCGRKCASHASRIGLMREPDVVQPERGAHPWAMQDLELRNLRFDVAHDAVVGGGGGAEDGHFRLQKFHHLQNAAVVRAEVVSPIRNAIWPALAL